MKGLEFLTNCTRSPSLPSSHLCVFLTSLPVLCASLKNLSPSRASVKTTFAMQGSEGHDLVLAFKADMLYESGLGGGRGVNIQRYLSYCLDLKRHAHSCNAKTTVHAKQGGAFGSRVLMRSLLIKAFPLAAI